MEMKDQLTVSIILITYNQENYIIDSLSSILNQEYESPIEIIVSDDNSTDNTFVKIQQVASEYKGMHRVILNKNEINLGLVDNINKAVSISTGTLLIFAAGDDLSYKQRTNQLINCYIEQSKKNSIYLIHSSVKQIDQNSCPITVGIPPLTIQNPSCEELIDQFSLVIGATCLLHRDLFTVFGPIKYKNAYEDLVLAFRAALLNSYKGNYYLHEILVSYRIGGLSSDNEKPKDRLKRKKYEIKKSNLELDVSKQRYTDAKLIGATHLLPLLEKKIAEIELQLKIHKNDVNLFEAIILGSRKKCLKLVVKTYLGLD